MQFTDACGVRRDVYTVGMLFKRLEADRAACAAELLEYLDDGTFAQWFANLAPEQRLMPSGEALGPEGTEERLRREYCRPELYDEAGPTAGGLCPVMRGGKWGALDREGRMAIPLLYEEIGTFSDGLSAVRREGKYGYTDVGGREAVPCAYGAAHPFFEGFALVKDPAGWKQIDRAGRDRQPVLYHNISDLGAGLFSARKEAGGPHGCIDAQGREAVPFLYDDITLSPGEEYLRVKTGGGLGLIDRQGRPSVPPVHSGLGSRFCEDLISAAMGGHWGYLDRRGAAAVPFLFEAAGDFSEGLAPVKIGGKWGFIDRSGTAALPFLYERAETFSEGLALVALDGKYGFIDPQGKPVIPLKYEAAGSFSCGLACVSVRDCDGKFKSGYIDRRGNCRSNGFPYRDASSFQDGVATVTDETVTFYADSIEYIWDYSVIDTNMRVLSTRRETAEMH